MITYRQPFKGDYLITQRYGEKDTSAFHTGIDYACPHGTQIMASADGVVMFSGWDSTGYGKMVIIQHNDGKATLYAHLAGSGVVLRQKVQQGDIIGLSGNTGNSTGPHLHFEARSKWNDYKSHQDPITYLPLMSMIDLPEPEEPSNTEHKPITAGTVRVVCDLANVRDPLNFTVRGQKSRGETFEITDGVKMISNLPYHRIIPRHVDDLGGLIAEYDGFGTQILEQVT